MSSTGAERLERRFAARDLDIALAGRDFVFALDAGDDFEPRAEPRA